MNHDTVTKITFFLFVFASANVLADVGSETQTAAEKLGASQVAEVTFEKGQYNLSDSNKEALNEFIQNANADATVDKAQVIAWSDREYPANSNIKLNKEDVTLAKRRAEAVKDYLRTKMSGKKVEIFNMAERPNGLQKLLKTKTAKLKTTLETTTAAPTSDQDTGLFGQNAKASTVVLFAY